MVNLSLLVLMLALWRSCGIWPALLAGLLIATSYSLFVFSRIALMDAPSASLGIIGLSLLLGWRPGRRPTWATVLAAVFGVLAVLCKTTIIAAMPSYLVAAWMTTPAGARRWRDPLIVAAVGVVLLGAYVGMLAMWFANDVAMFRSFNFQPRSVSLAGSVWRFAKSGNIVGEWLFGLGLVCLPLAVWRLRGLAVYPWVISLLIWLILMTGTVLAKGFIPPRYCVPLIPPVAVVIALLVYHGFRQDTGRIAGITLGAIVLIASARGAIDIFSAMKSPGYTYRDMGEDVRRRASEFGDPSQVVLWGRWPTGSVGLAADMPTHSLEGDMDAELQKYPVHFFLTRGPKEDPRISEQTDIVAMEERYHLELVTTYTVLPGYQFEPRPIHLYRVLPRNSAE